jgi:ubiquinone/menaquinone biosynthesis C-methylase UbiE
MVPGAKEGTFTMTDEQERKTAIRNTFNIVAGGYDNPSFRFFTISGEHMTDCLDLKGNEHVLDVATGTGIVALQLAPLVPRGRVTAIDFSEGMLAQARMKAAARAVGNVDFLEMDMQALSFPDGHFDAVTCAFGIFFVENMESQLRHMSDKVKAGGKVILSTFYDGSFTPLAEVFYDCLQRYGIERPVPTWKRISTEDKCASLLGSAGLSEIQVETRDIGYYLGNTEEWWNVIWNGGFRRYLSGLSTDDLAEFRKEHLAEVGKTATENGIWLDVKVLNAVGTRLGR